MYKVRGCSAGTPVAAKSRWFGIKMDASIGPDGEYQTCRSSSNLVAKARGWGERMRRMLTRVGVCILINTQSCSRGLCHCV